MSSNPNVKAIERIAIVGHIKPQTVANSETFTDVIATSQFLQFMAILMTATMAAETLDFQCYTCASDGSGAVLLKKMTQVASGTAHSDAQAAINVRQDELIASGAQYIKFSVLTGNTVGGLVSVVVLGVDSIYEPVSGYDLASVAQLIF